MQRCAASVVAAPQIQASELEKVNRNGLVSLGGHMEHIDAKVVSGGDICAMFNQELTNIRVTFEASEVQRCEAVSLVFLVYPSSQLKRCEILVP